MIPQAADGLREGADGWTVQGHPVAEVSRDDRPQIGAHFRDGVVQSFPQHGLHRLQLRLPPGAHRLPPHREPALPGPRAAMREAQEVERLRLPEAPCPATLGRIAAELHRARLLGVQRQPEPREPVTQRGQEALGLLALLETHHEVVGEPDDHDLAGRLSPTPAVDPLVEHVVE